MTEPGTTAAGQNLAALKIPELRAIAADQGLKGLSGLRKGELIQAITTGVVPRKAAAPGETNDEGASHGDTPAGDAAPQGETHRRRAARRSAAPADAAQHDGRTGSGQQERDDAPGGRDVSPRGGQDDNRGDSPENSGENAGSGDEQRYESRSAARRARRYRARQGSDNADDQRSEEQRAGDDAPQRDGADERQQDRGEERRGRGPRDGQDTQHDNGQRHNDRPERGHGGDSGDQDDPDRGGRGNRGNRNRNNGGNNGGNNRDDSEGGNRRGRRNRRNRNRNNRDNNGGNNGHQNANDGGNQNSGQDVDPSDLQEVAGIVDVVDNNSAFIRTTGYHQAAADVFVNNKLVRQAGLRSGDAVIGQVRANGQGHSHGSGRNKQRYNQLVRIDSVNGMTPEEAKQRKEFHKLTPLYPNKRLRLETEPNILTTRVIDLVMPIGKGQRALIVSPPKAGKTTILQNIANAIATNNPECYLMVVLVDERPEEVTDMQRSVKGEVIASTFDRPPSEHTAVAELAIERAKRLVEMGQDVVVLLDSITRLGRAYNNSSPASGRILSGGVDSNALYPPKRFLGAARNIEEGGSLTIIATAMVETGSAGDTVIFEEFKGTGNAELKLDRKISERRVFPAVDVNPSGTRKDELLMTPEEARIMHKLRRILSALDPQQSIDMLIKQLKKTKSNGEFLMGVAQSAPMATSQDEEEYS